MPAQAEETAGVHSRKEETMEARDPPKYSVRHGEHPSPHFTFLNIGCNWGADG